MLLQLGFPQGLIEALTHIIVLVPSLGTVGRATQNPYGSTGLRSHERWGYRNIEMAGILTGLEPELAAYFRLGALGLPLAKQFSQDTLS